MSETSRSTPNPSAAPRPTARAGLRSWLRRERWQTLLLHELWIDRRRASWGAEFAWSAVRVTVLSARGFLADQCLLRAAALTYITVLSLVPALAFSFSVTKGFGLHEKLIASSVDPFLDRTFGPLAAEGPTLLPSEGSHGMRVAIARVLEFVNQTNVSSLGVIGLVFLAYTLVNLLSTIERSFNVIWRARRSRSWVRKITDYIAMALITPLVILTAAALTAAVQSSAVGGALSARLGLGPVIRFLLECAPVLALWGGFTFAYMAMPNARTRFASALFGGLVAALLWQITLILHIRFQIGLARYNAIYSSFAAIPIFLVWVQMSWVIVLLGAEVCCAHQDGLRRAQALDRSTLDHEVKEEVALSAATRIAASFLAESEPWTADRLARELGVPLHVLDKALSALVAHEIVAAAQQAGADVYLLARDPEQVTAADVLESTRRTPARSIRFGPTGPEPEIARALAGMNEALRESHHNRTLKSLAQAWLAARSEPLARTGDARTIPSRAV